MLSVAAADLIPGLSQFVQKGREVQGLVDDTVNVPAHLFADSRLLGLVRLPFLMAFAFALACSIKMSYLASFIFLATIYPIPPPIRTAINAIKISTIFPHFLIKFLVGIYVEISLYVVLLP